MVKRRLLVLDLKSKGLIIIEGKRNNRHAKIVNPFNGCKAPLPRHREIDFFTAKSIYKELGLEIPNSLKR